MKRQSLFFLTAWLVPVLSCAADQCATPDFYPWNFVVENQSGHSLSFNTSSKNNCIVIMSASGGYQIKLRNPNVGFDHNAYVYAVRSGADQCGNIIFQYNGYYGSGQVSVVSDSSKMTVSGNMVVVGSCS